MMHVHGIADHAVKVGRMAGVQSIERAFSILRTLTNGDAGLTEIAAQVDLPKSTVARLLGALETEQVVARLDSGSYALGPGIEQIANSRMANRPLIDIARPFLVELTERTRESSGLDTWVDGWIHFIDNPATGHDLQVRDWTGESGPAHSIPAGLVILAHSPDDVVDRYIDQGLEAITTNTIVDPDELRVRLQNVRSAGYAWGFEEFAEGINSVAAPVSGPDGVIAALRVHGPAMRFPNPNRAHDIGLELVDVASRLSDQLVTK